MHMDLPLDLSLRGIAVRVGASVGVRGGEAGAAHPLHVISAQSVFFKEKNPLPSSLDRRLILSIALLLF